MNQQQQRLLLLPPPTFSDAQVPQRAQAGSCTTRSVTSLPRTSEKPARFRSCQLLQDVGVLNVACLAESSLSAPTPKVSLPLGVRMQEAATGQCHHLQRGRGRVEMAA